MPLPVLLVEVYACGHSMILRIVPTIHLISIIMYRMYVLMVFTNLGTLYQRSSVSDLMVDTAGTMGVTAQYYPRHEIGT